MKIIPPSGEESVVISYGILTTNIQTIFKPTIYGRRKNHKRPRKIGETIH